MMGVLVGPDGVFIVDAQFAPLTDKLVAAIKQISDGRMRFLVNTHVHGDHTGGDENFAKLGVTILARDELRTRLAVPGRGGPPPAAALPILTYKDRVTFHMNGEDIQLIPVPRGSHRRRHDGVFPESRRADDRRLLPVDSVSEHRPRQRRFAAGMLNGLAQVVSLAGPNTKIIPGHGPTVNKTAVAAQRDLMVAVRDRIAKLVAQGQTQEQVVAAKVTADLDAKVEQAGTTGDRFVGQVYAGAERDEVATS